MGGRGVYSYSGSSSVKDSSPLKAFAVASLNRGAAKGTTPEAAIARFREQLMNEKVEYSAYVDEMGYIHALGSTGKEGSTKVAPPSAIAKEKGVSAIIHNHPHGGSDGRKWGGPFSEGDLSYIASAYLISNGKINRIIATSNEGTYVAKVKKNVSQKQVRAAAKRADKSVYGKKYQSEIAMWRAVHNAYVSEFSKIGIDISFASEKKKSAAMKTEEIGTY